VGYDYRLTSEKTLYNKNMSTHKNILDKSSIKKIWKYRHLPEVRLLIRALIANIKPGKYVPLDNLPTIVAENWKYRSDVYIGPVIKSALKTMMLALEYED
jgi:hypothetical protein